MLMVIIKIIFIVIVWCLKDSEENANMHSEKTVERPILLKILKNWDLN